MSEQNKEYRQIAMLPLRGMLVFPYTVIHLDVGRKEIDQGYRRSHAG